MRVDSHRQEGASLLLANLTTSYLSHMEVNNSAETLHAANTIVKGVSNILDYASNVSVPLCTVLMGFNSTQNVVCFKCCMCWLVTFILEHNEGVNFL